MTRPAEDSCCRRPKKTRTMAVRRRESTGIEATGTGTATTRTATEASEDGIATTEMMRDAPRIAIARTGTGAGRRQSRDLVHAQGPLIPVAETTASAMTDDTDLTGAENTALPDHAHHRDGATMTTKAARIDESRTPARSAQARPTRDHVRHTARDELIGQPEETNGANRLHLTLEAKIMDLTALRLRKRMEPTKKLNVQRSLPPCSRTPMISSLIAKRDLRL